MTESDEGNYSCVAETRTGVISVRNFTIIVNSKFFLPTDAIFSSMHRYSYSGVFGFEFLQVV